MIVVEIDGVQVPFYQSTGSGGKKNVQSGKWYPFFGMGPDGWLNKTSENDINRYYDTPILKQVSELLDSYLGNLTGNALSGIKYQYGDVARIESLLHRDIGEPAMNGFESTLSKVIANIQKITSKLGGQYQYQKKNGGQLKYQHLRK